jgi:hypothetical protein
MSWFGDREPRADAGVADSVSQPGPTVAWLEDEFLDRYVCWREASEEVRAAYERWSSASLCDGATAFAAYRAALDREESAADDYRDAAEQLSARAR